MSLPPLTLSAARRLVLSAQGLLQPPAGPATKTGVLNAIRRMGALQIDTINVVARSPYLSLWSRLGDYDPNWLDQLLAEGAIFEYWSHAASFLPIEDYPYYRQLILAGTHSHRYKTWYEEHRTEVDPILEHVRQNGAVRSADFERKDGKKGTWWDWKIEKDALEYWLTAGELMVARREKFQRVYDLRQRVYPAWDDSQAVPLEETLRTLVLKSVQALGLARPAWVPDYFRLSKTRVSHILQDLLAEGQLRQIQVEGWPEPALFLPDNLPQVECAAAGGLEPLVTTLLSPFDALIWDRSRARQLFDFDFSIECYLPPPKRIYGYYLLPILHRGALVGRLDAKAHRQAGLFEVKALYLQEGITPNEELAAEFARALKRIASWHRTPQVILTRSAPEAFRTLLEPHLIG